MTKLIKLSRLEQAILESLRTEMYGLELADAVSLKLRRHISVGFLYPALNRLEKHHKLIEGRWDNTEIPKRDGARRRYYLITEYGSLTLELNKKLSSESNFLGSEIILVVCAVIFIAVLLALAIPLL